MQVLALGDTEILLLALLNGKQNSPPQFTNVSLEEAFGAHKAGRVLGGGSFGLEEILGHSEF